MKLSRLMILCSVLLWVSPLGATTSLGFHGGEYSISMEIGHDTGPVVASLRVHTPRAPDGVFLYGNFNTVAFDTGKRILSIEFIQQDPGQEPGSFTLTVRGEQATLRIDDKVITSPFNWFM